MSCNPVPDTIRKDATFPMSLQPVNFMVAQDQTSLVSFRVPDGQMSDDAPAADHLRDGDLSTVIGIISDLPSERTGRR
jgi:hypothetical protein